MSYRSFKRVLGETSLERKCRMLFGVSLLLLIATAFWYAGKTAEELVKQGPTRTGRSFVAEKIVSYHHLTWKGNNEAGASDDFSAMDSDLAEAMGSENLKWEILVLDKRGLGPESQGNPRFRVPEAPKERAILENIRNEIEAAFDAYGRDKLLPTEAGTLPALAAVDDENSPFNARIHELDSEDGDYLYYQPIIWKPGCNINCHQSTRQRVDGQGLSCYTYTAEDWLNEKDGNGQPLPDTLRVMKVVMPTDKTANEIMATRSVLAAIAIATVFFSMIALYAVVRYVIVKPLNHLREVSDEIGRGNYDLRANIQTRDEFEELAASFNRMLRHLVDTQAELRTVNNDLDGKVDQLAQANMQLHEMNRVKSDFLASMSHELRTPLNSIIGFADVLKENDSLSDKQKRYAANIGNSGRALLEMINDILDLAKAESGKMEVRLTEFHIDPVVNSQCDLVRSLSEEKNIDLTAIVQPDLPPLYQDQGKIQQIMINLLSNAIKFTPEGGRITVTAERDPMRHLVLTVQDTGVGIAEEERRVIFEKFRQGTRTVGTDHLTREFSGSGLGLSIVKELSKLLGGEVSFESELGKGSKFIIRVPWTLADQPRVDNSIQQRLDEVTKPRPLEFSSTLTRVGDEGPGTAETDRSTAADPSSAK